MMWWGLQLSSDFERQASIEDHRDGERDRDDAGLVRRRLENKLQQQALRY